jgi:hypothetical protein
VGFSGRSLWSRFFFCFPFLFLSCCGLLLLWLSEWGRRLLIAGFLLSETDTDGLGECWTDEYWM